VEGDRYLGFQELFLLFSATHTLKCVSKLMSVVKFLNVVFDMRF
jgi:hypothetical protein